jgi:HAD superfamily hydrolase (TIGR01509 family)
LWDFDGVICDTEPLHYQAFETVLAEEGLGYTWEEYQALFIGFDDRDGFREMFKQAGRTVPVDSLDALIERKADAFQSLIRKGTMKPYPGVAVLLDRLTAQDIPLGLCSGALRRDIDPLLALFGLEQAFQVIVTADTVSHSKPDPESYRRCLEQLTETAGRSLDTSRSVAIEDTPTGVAAARGAGLVVLGVLNTCTAAEMVDAQHLVQSLESVDDALLAALISGNL